MLARKSALLDAAVNSGCNVRVNALSRVLDTTKQSISIAMRRRVLDVDSQGLLPKLRFISTEEGRSLKLCERVCVAMVEGANESFAEQEGHC